MNPSASCKDDRRRDAVRAKLDWNGLDYLEVSEDQLTLRVFFLGKAPSQLLRRPDEEPAAYKKRLKQSVHIEGGRRIRGINVVDVEIHQAKDPKTGKVDPELDDWMDVRVDKYGDFSPYTLRLVGVENIDPFYDHLDFTFKAGCPSDLDCLPAAVCPPPALNEPEIDYLAKDYASFRQVILDRLALVMPDWQERHVPDLGIALVEVLAYAGDHLSYYQDAVATEAYLDTARQRISVRRHARLVDYRMHEGCNARAWVCIETDTDLLASNALDPQKVYFITGLNEALRVSGSVLTPEDLRNVPASQYEVFEPMTRQPIELYEAHSRMCFYTWGERECCLPKYATSATLKDSCDQAPLKSTQPSKQKAPYQPSAQQYSGVATPQSQAPERKLHLQAGDVLIFEEVKGPKTGDPNDADPKHRHAVRLTKVTPDQDPLDGTPIVEIEWAVEDALPFPLCLSVIGPAPGCAYIDDISIARGNVVLVDHGRTEPPEVLGVVPCIATQAECDCEGHPADITFVPGRYRPKLAKAPLTFGERLPKDDKPQGQFIAATTLMLQDAREALPQIELNSITAAPATNCEGIGPLFKLEDKLDPTKLISTLRDTSSPIAQVLRARFSKETLQLLDPKNGGDAISVALKNALIKELAQWLQAWYAQPDLLSSQPDDPHYVVEIDNDGYAHLRFGNGELGRLPEAGLSFFATYRVGNGSAGNVGAEAISHLVLRDTTLSGATVRVRNPLPALGGTDPEPVAEVKLFAPAAFRKELQRAITADDYAQLVQRDFKDKVQRAAGTLSWTGSWYEAQIAVDQLGGEEAEPSLLDEIKSRLYRYRRIGHDLAVQPAHYVSLDIAMTVCVLPHYLRGHVEAELLDVFSNRLLPDGRKGFFHPDRLTFGGGIYLSQLVAAAQAVTGVESVVVTKLQRQFEPPNGEIKNGVLPLGPLEIARVDNDPSFPEHGKLVLDVRGGR
jgi:hypothetical protein